ncbi:MAG: DUF1045 domain-containing protein [Arenibacterium sp.]
MYGRLAIFYTPDDPRLSAFGATWLGWDSAAGHSVPHPDVFGIAVADFTKTPRKYGFHATLKAPFRLSDGMRIADVIQLAEDFAKQQTPVSIEDLALDFCHGFLALRPRARNADLNALAAAVVREFEPVRAPLSESEIARRRKARLSPRQDAQMLKWGYPYVFEDFQFHMTLSGRLEKAVADQAMPVLQDLITPVLPTPLLMRSITIMGEDDAGMFHQLHRSQLSGT